MNKLIVKILVAVIVAGGAGFFGGMKYQQGKIPARGNSALGQNLQNLTPEQRQQLRQNNPGGARLSGNNSSGGFVAGEIIGKDEKSITVKLRDGGSKIVFLSNATVIGKQATGTPEDLLTGKQVQVVGTNNQDGTVTAQNINLTSDLPRPNSN